jgi:hypothetical protein
MGYDFSKESDGNKKKIMAYFQMNLKKIKLH